MLRAATRDDWDSIRTLLEEARLPTDGVGDGQGFFVVFEARGRIVGTGGIELYGRSGLLRSVAVADSHRRQGIAGRVCDELEASASRRSLESIHLLTETAEGFFAKRGYAPIDRSEAPPEIAASREFASICPDSATLMRYRIAEFS